MAQKLFYSSDEKDFQRKAVSKIRCFNGTDKGTADIGLFIQLFLKLST